MRAITYARVSTGKQAESGLSLDDQAERMGREISRRGWELVEARKFIDLRQLRRVARRDRIPRIDD